MAWSVITAAKVRGQLTAAEMTAIESAALAAGAANPLDDIISQVTDELRAWIRGAGQTVGPAGTLPAGLHFAAISIIRFRCLTRLTSPVSADRKTDYENALKTIQALQAGQLVVEEPAVAETETAAAPSPSMTDVDLTHQRADQDGL